MSSGITIVCREVCRQTGAVTAYVCKKDVEDRDLHLVVAPDDQVDVYPFADGEQEANNG